MDASKLTGYAVVGPKADGPSASKVTAYVIVNTGELTATKLTAYALVTNPANTERPSVFVAT